MEDDLPANELKIGGSTLSHPLPVKKTIEIDGRVLVLLETISQEVEDEFGDTPPRMRDNIIAYDTNGNHLWDIEPLKGSWDTFIGISAENGDVWAYAYGGKDIKVNLKDGTHVEEKYSR